MRIESVEIYSDTTNAAVMRHPGRRFPGCLIQGDRLNALIASLEVVQLEANRLSTDAADELLGVTDDMNSLLGHYKAVLSAHGIELPFNNPQSR